MNLNEETTEAVQISPDVLYNQDKASADMAVATAHAYPRNIKRAVDNAVAIVTMDIETAKTCTYSVPRGGKAITGPSVHLAKILSQVWGNLRVQAKVVAVGKTDITSQATAWDLESNLMLQVEVKRSIMSKTSGRYDESLIVVTGNAGNAIALRNAILSVIPRAIVDKVYKAAQQMITGDVSDENKLKARRKEVFDQLIGAYGIKEADILSAIGRASINHVTAEDIVVLIGIGTAIKDGDTTVDQAFKKQVKQAAPKTEDKENERIDLLIKDIQACETIEKLAEYKKSIGKDPRLKKAYEDHKKMLETLDQPKGPAE